MEDDVSVRENLGLDCSTDSTKRGLSVFKEKPLTWVLDETMRKGKEGLG